MIRIDGQNRSAPHYVVDSMMKQIRYPNIAGATGFKIIEQKDDIAVVELDLAFRNFSKTQNDESFGISIFLGGGARFYKNGMIAENQDHYWNNGLNFKRDDIWPILHYGMLYHHKEQIKVDMNKNNSVKFFTVVDFLLQRNQIMFLPSCI